MKKLGKLLLTLIGKILFPLFSFSMVTAFISFFSLILIEIPENEKLFLIVQAVLLSVMILLYLFVLYKRDKSNTLIWSTYIGYTFVTALVFTVTFAISNGVFTHLSMNANLATSFVFGGLLLLSILVSDLYSAVLVIGGTLALSALFATALFKKKYLPHCAVIVAAFLVVNLGTYFNSPNYKYQGHGFEYMNGYSSTDLTDYTPYSDSGKLVTLDHEASFQIENEKDMPILDGAEACYPVYSAIAKAVYKDIDKIEEAYSAIESNGKIVTFYNTADGYERLFAGEVDMFFGAKPSKSQLERAAILGVELEYTQIGKEAFVFFVNENNPIEDLSSDEIRAIYHGDITNFEEVGGKNESIVAFQRPERSGSQAMMQYFMGDVSLKEPLTYENIGAMAGIIKTVAEYHNESGAIGYTFKYFLEGLNQEDDVKILSLDGVYPTTESIQNGTYPAVAGLYCVTLKGNNDENVQKMLDFLLSEDGQYIIEKTGYCPMN